MKNVLALVTIGLIMVPKMVFAADLPNDIVISQVVLGTSQNASDEIVVIYNNTDADFDISGLLVQYKSATGTTWSTRATVASSVSLAAHHDYAFASVQTADAKLSAGLAQSGGNIRLMLGGTEHDRLAWGAGDSPLGTAVAAPGVDETIDRTEVVNSDVLQNTHDNSQDFTVGSSTDTNTTTNPTDQTGSQDSSPVSSPSTNTPHSLQITELLPDPVSPQTDSNDEFIEVYNPNSTAVSMKGWKLIDAGGKAYTFGDGTVPALGYLAVYSKDSHISLNNSGDTVKLVDAQAAVVDESVNYDSAKEGLSWGLTDDGWAWMQLSPNHANGPAISTDTGKSIHDAGSTKKVKSASKKTVAKKLKSAIAKAASAKGLTGDNEDSAATKPLYNVWSWLLLAAGVGTIGYGIYEYRPELKTAYYKLRAKLGRRG